MVSDAGNDYTRERKRLWENVRGICCICAFSTENTIKSKRIPFSVLSPVQFYSSLHPRPPPPPHSSVRSTSISTLDVHYTFFIAKFPFVIRMKKGRSKNELHFISIVVVVVHLEFAHSFTNFKNSVPSTLSYRWTTRGERCSFTLKLYLLREIKMDDSRHKVIYVFYIYCHILQRMRMEWKSVFVSRLYRAHSIHYSRPIRNENEKYLCVQNEWMRIAYLDRSKYTQQRIPCRSESVANRISRGIRIGRAFMRKLRPHN